MSGKGFYMLNELIYENSDIDMLIMSDVIGSMSTRYTCLRPPGAAGAALLTANNSIVYGAVRPASGSATCEQVGCMMEDGHCVRTIHAEVRAILNAARFGLVTEGATMYSILKPCFQCTKVIVTAGISKIVYAGAAYDEERTRLLIENAPQRIEIVRLTNSNGAPLIDYAQEK